ncbi:MAG: signal peptidase II [Candidatus Paceibacterota bacterium]
MRKNLLIFLIIAAAVVILDRISKIFSPDGKCLAFICVKHTTNSGAALSLFSNFSLIIPILIIIAFAVLAATAFFYFREKKFGMLHIGLLLLFAGTLGNLIDRILFRHVIDFMTFSFMPQFPAFNLSDMANVAGAIIIIIALLRKK